jgi:ubiquinone/menaquinone biosynthesis C-methylase UbiE
MPPVATSPGSKRMDQRASWDRLYSSSAPRWKGPPSDVPGPSPGALTLELGCGDGKTLTALSKAGTGVVAIDFSLRAIQACRRGLGGNAMMVLGDVIRLPFTDGAFNTVVAHHVLGHLQEKDRELAIAEIIRVMDPGGSLSLSVFSVNDMRAGKGMLVEEGTYLKGDGIMTHYFTQEEVRSLMKQFNELSLVEKLSKKRFDGNEFLRAELRGAFVRP